MIAPLDAFFLLLVLLSGIAALAVRDLLASIIIYAAFSFFAAVFYASLGALDVAFTEAAVGAAVTTVLFVAVIFRIERRVPAALRPVAIMPAAAVAVAFLLAAAALLRGVAGLPAVGDPDSPPARHVSPRYIEAGPAETGAPNMVTAVLADYRGYDTLGETVVIFTAALASLLVLGERGRRPRGRVNVPFGSPLLDTAVRLLAPFILLFAAYVVGHGHSSPGGGFQGGVVMAAALILVRMVHGSDVRWGPSSTTTLGLAAAGLLVYIGIGFLAVASGGQFLDYGAIPLPLEPAEVRAVGTFGIEVGVGLTVAGVMVFLCGALMGWEETA